MAKKKARAAKAANDTSESGRVRVELRLERKVFERVRQLADKAEVSLNQLFGGLAEFAADMGHAGDLVYEGARRVCKWRSGVVTFGLQGRTFTREEVEELAEFARQLPPGEREAYLEKFPTPTVGQRRDTGLMWFTLDFNPKLSLQGQEGERGQP